MENEFVKAVAENSEAIQEVAETTAKVMVDNSSMFWTGFGFGSVVTMLVGGITYGVKTGKFKKFNKKLKHTKTEEVDESEEPQNNADEIESK